MTLMGYVRHLNVMTAYNDALTERYPDGNTPKKVVTR
jgi:hypothetical protein